MRCRGRSRFDTACRLRLQQLRRITPKTRSICVNTSATNCDANDKMMQKKADAHPSCWYRGPRTMGILRIKQIMYKPGCPRPTFQTACRATTPLLLPCCSLVHGAASLPCRSHFRWSTQRHPALQNQRSASLFKQHARFQPQRLRRNLPFQPRQVRPRLWRLRLNASHSSTAGTLRTPPPSSLPPAPTR